MKIYCEIFDLMEKKWVERTKQEKSFILIFCSKKKNGGIINIFKYVRKSTHYLPRLKNINNLVLSLTKTDIETWTERIFFFFIMKVGWSFPPREYQKWVKKLQITKDKIVQANNGHFLYYFALMKDQKVFIFTWCSGVDVVFSFTFHLLLSDVYVMRFSMFAF